MHQRLYKDQSAQHYGGLVPNGQGQQRQQYINITDGRGQQRQHYGDMTDGRGQQRQQYGDGRDQLNQLCGNGRGQQNQLYGDGRGPQNRLYGDGHGPQNQLYGDGRGQQNQLYGDGRGQQNQLYSDGRGQQNQLQYSDMEQLLQSVRYNQKQLSGLSGSAVDSRQAAYYEQKIRQLQNDDEALKRRYNRKPEGIEFLLELDSMKASFDEKHREFSTAAAHIQDLIRRVDDTQSSTTNLDTKIDQLRAKHKIWTQVPGNSNDQDSILKRSAYLNVKVDAIRTAMKYSASQRNISSGFPSAAKVKSDVLDNQGQRPSTGRNTVYVRRASEWPDERKNSNSEAPKILNKEEDPRLYAPQVQPISYPVPSKQQSSVIQADRNEATNRYMPAIGQTSGGGGDYQLSAPVTSSYGRGYAVVGDSAASVYTTSNNSNNTSADKRPPGDRYGANSAYGNVPLSNKIENQPYVDEQSKGYQDFNRNIRPQSKNSYISPAFTQSNPQQAAFSQSNPQQAVDSRASPFTVIDPSSGAQYRPMFASKNQIASTYLKKPGGLVAPAAATNQPLRYPGQRVVSPIKAFQRPTLPGPTALVRPMVQVNSDTNAFIGDPKKLIKDQNQPASSTSSVSSDVSYQRDVNDKISNQNQQSNTQFNNRMTSSSRLRNEYADNKMDGQFNSSYGIYGSKGTAVNSRVEPSEWGVNHPSVPHYGGWEKVVERLPSDQVDGLGIQRTDSMRMQKVPRPVRRRTSGESADNSLQKPSASILRASGNSHSLFDTSIDEESPMERFQPSYINIVPAPALVNYPSSHMVENSKIASGPALMPPYRLNEAPSNNGYNAASYNVSNAQKTNFVQQEKNRPPDYSYTIENLRPSIRLNSDSQLIDQQKNVGDTVRKPSRSEDVPSIDINQRYNDNSNNKGIEINQQRPSQSVVTDKYNNQSMRPSVSDEQKLSPSVPLDLTAKQSYQPSTVIKDDISNKNSNPIPFRSSNLSSFTLSPITIEEVLKDDTPHLPSSTSSDAAIISATSSVVSQSTSFIISNPPELPSDGIFEAEDSTLIIDSFISDSEGGSGEDVDGRGIKSHVEEEGDAGDKGGDGLREGEPEYIPRYSLDVNDNPLVTGILKRRTGEEEGMERRSRRRVRFDPLALLLDASLEGDMNLLAKVISEVADPSACNDEGITALHNAICAGHCNVVQFLVSHGCDVNSPDTDGWRPLHCAASCNNLSMAQLLIENGACVFAATTNDDETAAEKCEEDEMGYEGCSKYLTDIEESLGVLNDGVVHVVYDYEASHSDELSVRRGDVLRVLRRGDDSETEWWFSRTVNGQAEGYVPRNILAMYPVHGSSNVSSI